MTTCQDIPNLSVNAKFNVCRASKSNPFKGSISFDNIGYAFIVIFQVRLILNLLLDLKGNQIDFMKLKYMYIDWYNTIFLLGYNPRKLGNNHVLRSRCSFILELDIFCCSHYGKV